MQLNRDTVTVVKSLTCKSYHKQVVAPLFQYAKMMYEEVMHSSVLINITLIHIYL